MKKIDYSYLSELSWDSETIGLLTRIYEYNGRQKLYLKQKPVKYKQLSKMIRLKSADASIEIEGDRRSYAPSIKVLYPPSENETEPSYSKSDKEMIKGYRDALSIAFKDDVFNITPDVILELHRELYKYSDKKGGSYRVSGGSAVFAYDVPKVIEEMCNSYNLLSLRQRYKQYKDVDVLILIPVFIRDYFVLQPFDEGEIKMCCLLLDLLLYRSDFMIGKYISLESKIARRRGEFSNELWQNPNEWRDSISDHTSFIKLLLRIILEAYEEFEKCVSLLDNKLTAKEIVRQAFGSGTLQRGDVLRLCPTLSRASVENSLRQLVEDGYLNRIGDGRSTYYMRSQLSYFAGK